jgi:hypothetical protein
MRQDAAVVMNAATTLPPLRAGREAAAILAVPEALSADEARVSEQSTQKLGEAAAAVAVVLILARLKKAVADWGARCAFAFAAVEAAMQFLSRRRHPRS